MPGSISFYMQDKLFFEKLRERQLEVSSIPIQDLGFLDGIHKSAGLYIKIAPWKLIIPLSILFIILFKVVTGASLVSLVSILQEGF